MAYASSKGATKRFDLRHGEYIYTDNVLLCRNIRAGSEQTGSESRSRVTALVLLSIWANSPANRQAKSAGTELYDSSYGFVTQLALREPALIALLENLLCHKGIHLLLHIKCL